MPCIAKCFSTAATAAAATAPPGPAASSFAITFPTATISQARGKQREKKEIRGENRSIPTTSSPNFAVQTNSDTCVYHHGCAIDSFSVVKILRKVYSGFDTLASDFENEIFKRVRF